MATTLDARDLKWLKRVFGTNVKYNELMSKHTSFRVGGPAQVYVEPETLKQLIELMGWITDKHIPYMTIGSGTNLLVRDKGIHAIVISLARCLNKISKTDADKNICRVEAMAGATLRSLCRFALNNSLSGMNFAIGIPGTIGGAIKMNAGTAHGVMKNVLSTIRILHSDGKTETLAKHQLNFDYRNLSILNTRARESNEPPIILNGLFVLNQSNDQELKQEARNFFINRKKQQPIGLPSAGSFFKNPSKDQPAGLLIDQAGLKGTTFGDAAISTKHANFIINKGNASAADIIGLMENVQDKIFKQYNINLEPEVKIVGE